MARIGTLNVRTARGGNLEACLKGCGELHLDVVVLTETHLNDEKYTRRSHGFEIFATTTQTAFKGGVALAVKRDRGRTWEVEDFTTYSENVLACTITSGDNKWRLIGAYIPPSEADGSTLDALTTAASETPFSILVLGDFNANLGESTAAQQRGPVTGDVSTEPRSAAVMAMVSSLGLRDAGKDYRQRKRTGTWTWAMDRMVNSSLIRVRSMVDYILVQGRQRLARHRVRQVPYADTDHRIVYADLPQGNTWVHQRYMGTLEKFPVPLPTGDNRTLADMKFQTCLESKPKPKAKTKEVVRPNWISESTWGLIRRKVTLRSLRGTVARRAERQRLKRAIKEGLGTDREARLTKAATEIEEAMEKDTQLGYRLLARWYKRREGKGIKLSPMAMGRIEQEYGALYAKPAAPTGEMIPLGRVRRQQFRVPDGIPDDAEIRAAAKRLRRGKAPGPTGLTVDHLRDWEADNDPSKWEKVVELIQFMFETGEAPSAFKIGTLVLIPKAEVGKYWGIALLECLYKLLSCLVNIQVSDNIRFHDGIHGFQSKRSCSTGILEAKLAMQRARREGRIYHQVFLDLSKAYDTLDRERMAEVMQAYGIGPRIMTLLESTWKDSGVVPKKAGRYGGVIRTDRGVKQGDIPSPTFFNLVIDAILHAEEESRAQDEAPTSLDTSFYADDGRIGGYDARAVQRSLDVFTNLFARMGLQMNASKTEAMSTTTTARPTAIRTGAYHRKLEGAGAEYITRSSEMGECPVCAQPLQKRSLARHLRDQHPGVAPPPLDLETVVSPVRDHGGREFHLRMTGSTPCPDESCPFAAAIPNIMRRHFLYQHPRDTLYINGDRTYTKCQQCDMMVRQPITDRHRASDQCQQGARRKAARELQAAAEVVESAPATFFVGGTQLKMVSEFRYLGRILSSDDSDLAACLRNISRARAKWGQLSRILRADGASPKTTARFYLVIVSAMLLYGCETWVITTRMENILTAFHNRCARTIGKTFIRCVNSEENIWEYPEVRMTLRAAHLEPLKTYLNRRRVKFREYAVTRNSYNECRRTLSIAQPFPTLWEQLDATEA